MSEHVKIPPQQLPFSKKNKAWRKQHLDWADSKTFFNYNLVRKSVMHKKINYDLLNGKLHMNDLQLILNPDNQSASFVPDKIQHYPIINSKINVLRGEESKRVFDFRVTITNPTAISEIEENKKNELIQKLQQILQNTELPEEEYKKEIEKLNDFYTYSWQDLREIRGNTLLNHYVKEYNIPLLFNQGFIDGITVGEEIYQCDIRGGEPVIERVNPLKIRVFQSGYSNKIEDADMIILEDYWSPGKIIDSFYDVLSKKDMKYIEDLPNYVGQSSVDSMDNLDERQGYINTNMIDDTMSSSSFYFDPLNLFSDTNNINSLLPYDLAGNVRVLRVYWKSRRRIKKVKSYDFETGEEVYTFYPENYIINKDLGEEEQIFYINEAWEGVKIGEEIYINMRPRPIQYNRLSNPSRCHFGIVGSIYNLNDSKPFSLVDMMKPYSYLYDVIHDRLNKAIASNWGSIMELDFASIPKGWDVEKWMYYARVNKIAVKDSFKEGNIGVAQGKLAGAFAANSRGMLQTNDGDYIQQQINLLEFIKLEMSEVAGITRQREGQISNRETVGGVERATLQSSHITEWLFTIHEDVKKRALECFLETAKIALKGRSKKFQYILSDSSSKIMEIEGDEFAECDYGLVVDNSSTSQELNQKLDMLAQAALQNQTLSFSTIMKIYGSSSIAEKTKLVETDEQKIQERKAQEQQAISQSEQEKAQVEADVKMQELQQKEQSNIRDNETKLLIATMNKPVTEDGVEEVDLNKREELLEKIRQFDLKLQIEKEKLTLDKKKHQDDVRIKEKMINKRTTNLSK